MTPVEGLSLHYLGRTATKHTVTKRIWVIPRQLMLPTTPDDINSDAYMREAMWLVDDGYTLEQIEVTSQQDGPYRTDHLELRDDTGVPVATVTVASAARAVQRIVEFHSKGGGESKSREQYVQRFEYNQDEMVDFGNQQITDVVVTPV